MTDAVEPVAQTANVDDHEDPDVYRGEDAEPPTDTGKPPEVS